jgi:hypothetical protein
VYLRVLCGFSICTSSTTKDVIEALEVSLLPS